MHAQTREPSAGNPGAPGPGGGIPGDLPPLSVAIVCRSNEATIGRTLASVAPIAREIVALDSGSTDRTIEMLEASGARVERVRWEGYNATKQRAAMACTQPWVLNVDSDESVEADLAGSIRQALADPGMCDGFMVNRKVWYAGRFLEHAWQPEWRLRLARRAMFDTGEARFSGTEPHDELTLASGRVGRLRGTLRHDTIADMRAFLAGQLRLAATGAEMRRQRGRRGTAWAMMSSPAGAFLKQLVLRSAWRDGWRGWAAAGATACHALMKQLVLLEQTHIPPADPPGV